MAQLLAVFPHGVVERHDRPARDPKHHIHALANERFAHYLRASSLFRHSISPAHCGFGEVRRGLRPLRTSQWGWEGGFAAPTPPPTLFKNRPIARVRH